MQALGLIEVDGYLAAIASADSALKAANVTLLKAEKISGGITTVELIGDVAAVSAAVEAGKRTAESLHHLRGSHVIARLDQETEHMLLNEPTKKEAVQPVLAEKTSSVVEAEKEKAAEPTQEQEAVEEKPSTGEPKTVKEPKPIVEKAKRTTTKSKKNK